MKKFINVFTTYISIIFKNILVKKIRRLDIFKRLIISFLIVIIIPNTIIGFFSLNKFSTEMDHTISKFSYSTLHSLDTSITERLKKYKDLANNLCRNDELKDLLSKCENLTAANQMNAFQQEEYINYKNRIGNILFSTSSSFQDISNISIISDNDEFIQINHMDIPIGGKIYDLDSFRNTEYYKRALEAFNIQIWWDTSKENSTYESLQYPSTYLGSYITVLKALPITGSGKSLGVIVINISIPLSNMFTDRDQYFQDGDLILISDSGIIQYFNTTPYFIKLDSTVIKEVVNLNKESIVKRLSGKDYLISAVKSDFTGWTLCSVIPRSSLLQKIYEIRTLIIQICFICIVVAFILSYIVTISISRPLKKLKYSMEKVDETNIEIEYIDDMNDEVGVLGQKFNSMIKRIQNLINTVYEAELNKKEEMLKRKEAELDALQMQINPHFLYNTLDIIRWQILEDEHGESKASQMLSSFADLLRLGTKRSSYLVQISEEIEHVKAYIDVVQFDLEYELHVKYIINDDLLSYKLPKFTLQPLIENVIVHGFAHKKGLGEIVIEAYMKDNEIFIEITDNGGGISPDILSSINQNLNMVNNKSNSIGLKNVNARIKLYFGEPYGLELVSIPGESTTAIVHIPLIFRRNTYV